MSQALPKFLLQSPPAAVPGAGGPGLLHWAVANGRLDPLLTASVIARAADAEPAATRRTKVWELGASLHCSIIGTCLTTGELGGLLRKFDVIHGEADEHEIHSLAVGAILRRGPLAKQIQKLLDQRHKAAIAQLAKLATPEALGEAWVRARAEGEIPGFYWAILSHPATTPDLAKRVFGDVHMLSHLVGAANRADIRRLARLEQDKQALEETVARQQRQLQDGLTARDAQIRALNHLLSQRIEQQQPAPAAPDSQVAALEGLVADLRRQLDAETARRRRAEHRLDERATALAGRERQAEAMEQEIGLLRAELAAIEARLAPAPQAADTETAPGWDLAGATILYVGGQPHHIARLRATVEQARGHFIHHDGGIEEQASLIPGLVSRADIAVFPVDCISHAAALAVKRQCRQAGKPFVPLRSSGIASLLHGLGAASPAGAG